MLRVGHKAIIFNCHYNGLSIIQELARHGIECIAMDSVRSIGTFSRYAKFERCPDPLSRESDFIQFLYDYCKKFSLKPVLFPTNDHWAMAISRSKRLLSEVAIPCVGDWNAVNLVLEKEKFYRLGYEKNWLTPRTWVPNGSVDIPEDSFPLVAKPNARRVCSNDGNARDFSRNMDRLRLKILETQEDLQLFLKKEEKFLSHVILQECVLGNSSNMFTVGVYVSQNQKVLGIFTGKKLRGYPAQEGDCIAGINYAVPDYVVNNTLNIIQEIRYSGIAEFEYMQDSRTGDFKLIEINPRSWSWVGITPLCSVSLPWIAYQDLIGCNVNLHTSFKLRNASVLYVKVLPDLLNSLYRYKRDYPAWSKSFGEWRKELENFPQKVYAEFNAKDKLIAFYSVLLLVGGWMKSKVRKLLKRG